MTQKYAGDYPYLVAHVKGLSERFNISISEAFTMLTDKYLWSIIELLEREDKTLEDIQADAKKLY